jgi:hypothetical protein
MSIRPSFRPSAGGDRMRRLGIPLAAGLLVTIGAFALISSPANSDTTADLNLIDTVVAVRPIEAGTSTDDLDGLVEIRQLPAQARANGALTNIDQLPAGTLVADHVAGQQVLTTSIADDPIDAIGDDLVAVSVRLDPQRWTGPFTTTGAVVDIYETSDIDTTLIVSEAQIIDAPDTAELDPRSEAVITLAVPVDGVTAVITAASTGQIWMVGR